MGETEGVVCGVKSVVGETARGMEVLDSIRFGAVTRKREVHDRHAQAPEATETKRGELTRFMRRLSGYRFLRETKSVNSCRVL